MKGGANFGLSSMLKRQLKKNVQIKNETRILMEKQFKIAHNKLMSDFEKHPLTRELSGGAEGSNVTGTMTKGNVYSFIGFESGYDPVEPIRSLLISANILFKNRSMGPKGILSTYSVNIPTAEELYKVTPMPWAKGASWLQQIEQSGISGLGQYMDKRSSNSRSGRGIQLKSRSAGGRLQVSYIRPMLKQFESNLNKMQGK